MKRLYVLYDSTCQLCRACRAWLDRQPTFVPLVFLSLQLPEVARRFPGIEQLHPEEELLVVSDTGDVWRGGSAWVMCLWALQEYREWSERLAHPALLPLARRACQIVSENRHRLSSWLFDPGVSPEELRRHLTQTPPPLCTSAGCGNPINRVP